ncbi:hypothetical protein V500_01052 [Pseudogymnoascus sp. VKM F-4518 (FW-2643)]|nr:hypothetical protein V500_01052 [Pseudogymnoascus sp. VKM F-4518 (FW-2643)]
MTIRTACSSSMIGLHEACQALYNGECSGAIVAGSSLILSPSMTIAMTQQGVLSPTGSCKTFDAAADGFARGEAVNAVFIKLLDDAIRDNDPIRAVIRSTAINSDGKCSLHKNDPIRAVIRSTAINSDGKTPGISVPNSTSQEAVIRRAYNVAGISDMSKTPFFECHGTGTQVGDAVETTAVANVFGECETYIGSVKPNVGHSEGASGITSLIKVVLALENETIPPNINFSKPNPKIAFQKGKLHVPVEAIPWPRGRHARVSINSFGIGGANAHAIVDSAASFGIYTPNDKLCNLENLNGHLSKGADEYSNGISNRISNGHSYSKGHSISETKSPSVLLPISANNLESLRIRVEDLCCYHGSQPGSLAGIAHTLGARRDHLLYRAFCIATCSARTLNFESFQKKLTGAVEVVFVFTGQGAQWAGMGRDLIQSSPSFCDDIRRMDKVLQDLPEPPQWTIEAILSSEDGGDLINKAEFSQPLCTAIQVALVNYFAKCNVTPSAVVGHSSGEIAAAYAARAITVAEAILISYYRGLVTKCVTQKGSMAVVGLSRESASAYLANGATVACVNSPMSTTISGNEDAIEQSLEAIRAEDSSIFTRRLHVEIAYHSLLGDCMLKIAYHSHHMREVGDKYEEMVKPHLSSTAGTAVPFYSSVTGQLITPTTLQDPAYWRSNLESPVLFSSAVKALLDDLQHKVLVLEVGPHSALQGPLNQIFRKRSEAAPIYIPTLIRGNNSASSVLRAAGQLRSSGMKVAFHWAGGT